MVTATDDPVGTPLGYNFCFEVQEIDDKFASYVLPETGQTFQLHRLPQGSPACPEGAF